MARGQIWGFLFSVGRETILLLASWLFVSQLLLISAPSITPPLCIENAMGIPTGTKGKEARRVWFLDGT